MLLDLLHGQIPQIYHGNFTRYVIGIKPDDPRRIELFERLRAAGYPEKELTALAGWAGD